MARDVDSLVLCLRALLCDVMFQLDPTVPPIPFNEQVRGLKEKNLWEQQLFLALQMRIMVESK